MSCADSGRLSGSRSPSEVAMFEAEARWLLGALEGFPPERLSPLLTLGSSYAAFRESVQPWIEHGLLRPWLLLRHLARLPVPFLSLEKWKRSMAKLYWLGAEYRITCAVFEKL